MQWLTGFVYVDESWWYCYFEHNGVDYNRIISGISKTEVAHLRRCGDLTKNGKQITKFGETETEKHKFHHKNLISLYDADINKMLVSY